jgi:hypothetical protein
MSPATTPGISQASSPNSSLPKFPVVSSVKKPTDVTDKMSNDAVGRIIDGFMSE